MRDLKINAEGDLDFNGRDFAWITNSAEVVQRVSTRLRSVLGGWVFERSLGLDWFGPEGIHSTEIGHDDRVAIFRDCIASTDGVASVDSIDIIIDNDNRAARIVYTATTIYHEAVEGEVPL
jgi:hypothetical protein